ncbi:hypothetical protein KKB64_04160 [Patescibacteria group bacterium]|nr:hypothetical protein [Patescibacteria group bacterium]MBU2459703.1 hypothetical protein [Patescibacteria group bacterium]
MRNWSVDEAKLKKFPRKYARWKLEQQVSYGLDKGEKIDRRTLLKHWQWLRPRLDPKRAELVKFLLWG